MKGIKYRVYWDSNVWIAWSNNEDEFREFHPLCKELLRDADSGEIEIAISPLVVAEFAPPDENEKLFEQYLLRPSFIKIAITWHISREARGFTRKYSKLPGRDALHLSCAIYSRCDYLFTFDKDLLSIAGEVSDIIICKPTWPDGRMRLLFEEVAMTKEPQG